MYDEAPVELTDELGRLVYKQVITPIVFAARQVAYYSADEWLRFRTGGNYVDDASSDASDITFRPKVVHLGHYAPRGSAILPLPLSFSGPF
jgi:hypothetical protein